MTVEQGYVALDSRHVDTDVLEDAMWRLAKGSWKQEAAVLLLTFHGHWPSRPAFREHVEVTRQDNDLDGPLWAEIDWPALGAKLGRPFDPEHDGDQLAQSSSRELRILRLAASIAGGQPVDLNDALDSGYDDTNARLVQAAVVHAMRGFDQASALWPVRV